MTLAVEALKRKRGEASGGASSAAPSSQRRGSKLPWLLGSPLGDGAASWPPAASVVLAAAAAGTLGLVLGRALR